MNLRLVSIPWGMSTTKKQKHKRQKSIPARFESAALGGAFAMLISTIPVRSETWVHSIQELMHPFIQLVLIFLGLTAPAPEVRPVTPVVMPVRVVKPRVQPPAVEKPLPNAMFLRRNPTLKRYTYIFEGKATSQGIPCAKASVLIRMTSGDVNVTKGGITEEDGSYSIQLAIDAVDKAPVDWTIEAYTPDFEKIELYGRKIVSMQEDTVVVQKPVDFPTTLTR